MGRHAPTRRLWRRDRAAAGIPPVRRHATPARVRGVLATGARLDPRAEAAARIVDAASEAIAYEGGFDGEILDPVDVAAAIQGVIWTICQAPVAALAAACYGLTASTSLLSEAPHHVPLPASTPVGSAAPSSSVVTATAPLGFYGL